MIPITYIMAGTSSSTAVIGNSKHQQHPVSSSSWVGLVVAVSAAVVSTAAAAWYHRYHRRRRRHQSDSHDTAKASASLSLDHQQQQQLAPPLQQAFDQAAQRIRQLLDDPDALADDEKLLLYALYKQFTVGNAPTRFTPSSWNLLADQAKHHAWSQVRDMSPVQAAVYYIEAVHKLLDDLATEADEGMMDLDDDDDDAAPTAALSNNMAAGSPYKTTNGGSRGFAHAVSLPMVVEEHDNNAALVDETAREAFLLRAASDNNIAELQALLLAAGHGTSDSDSNLDINYQDDDGGQSALHLAADQGHVEAVQVLLNAGAAPDLQDHDGISVLQAAVIAGHVHICQLLLQAGAPPDACDHDGDSPWSCALDDGSPSMQKLFAQYSGAQAAVNIVDEDDSKENRAKR